MTVLAALLLPVWATILGFGPARWLGTELGGRASHGGGRAGAAAPDDIESESSRARRRPRTPPRPRSPARPPPARRHPGPQHPWAVDATADAACSAPSSGLGVGAARHPRHGTVGRVRPRRRQRGDERGDRGRLQRSRADLRRARPTGRRRRPAAPGSRRIAATACGSAACRPAPPVARDAARLAGHASASRARAGARTGTVGTGTVASEHPTRSPRLPGTSRRSRRCSGCRHRALRGHLSRLGATEGRDPGGSDRRDGRRRAVAGRHGR